MKTFIALLLLAVVTLSSCDDATNSNENSATAKVMEVENRAINGQQWRITNFTQSNVDQTPVFSGFIFEFDSNSLLTSTNGSENFSGSWAVKTVGNDEENKSEFDDIDFSIDFTNPTMFADLAGKWKIVSITDTRIELRHRSGDSSQISLITFERI